MHVRQLLTLAAAVAAGATSVSTLQAQAPAAPPAPQVTVSGVVYGQYQYDLKDSVGAAGVQCRERGPRNFGDEPLGRAAAA